MEENRRHTLDGANGFALETPMRANTGAGRSGCAGAVVPEAGDRTT
ncbi:protein of unknown function [Rhodovastum atsumiense]|nr:protein of unknown function [Rhodovastum atsumiense]